MIKNGKYDLDILRMKYSVYISSDRDQDALNIIGKMLLKSNELDKELLLEISDSAQSIALNLRNILSSCKDELEEYKLNGEFEKEKYLNDYVSDFIENSLDIFSAFIKDLKKAYTLMVEIKNQDCQIFLNLM